MTANARKFISITYDMYDITAGKNVLIETVAPTHPMQLITGIDMIPLQALEEKWSSLSTGDDYELVLTCDMAFGEYDPDAVVDIPKEQLCINGRFASEIFQPGAMLPLQNQNGERVSAKVIEVGETHVTVDCNHPLAGKDLLVRGKMVESRPATDEDVMSLTMPHCGGGCGGGCHGNSCGDGGCGGCGNCGEGDCDDSNCCGGGCSHCAS